MSLHSGAAASVGGDDAMPPREGQGADITCGITVAVDACLKGVGDIEHSRSTRCVAVDACLKGVGDIEHSRSTRSVAVDACLKGGGATQHLRNTCGIAMDA